MAIGSKVLGFNQPQPRTSPLRSVYDAAATTQAQDYDDIMRGYDDLIGRTKSSSSANQPKFNPLSSISSNYQPNYTYNRSGDMSNLVSGLQDFSRTGGYSEGDIGNIRERAISPIRSIYSSAQEGLRRQKVLQGGYSPNYGAVSAKMARDASSSIGDITTNVNAEIARMIASGKLSGLQSLSPVVTGENQLQNQISSRNEDARRETMAGNTQDQRNVRDTNLTVEQRIQDTIRQMKEAETNTELQALGGKQSLYGTTPALTQTFANQVLQNNQQNMQAAQTANMIKNQRANIGLNLVNSQLAPRNISGVSLGRG